MDNFSSILDIKIYLDILIYNVTDKNSFRNVIYVINNNIFNVFDLSNIRLLDKIGQTNVA